MNWLSTHVFACRHKCSGSRRRQVRPLQRDTHRYYSLQQLTDQPCIVPRDPLHLLFPHQQAVGPSHTCFCGVYMSLQMAAPSSLGLRAMKALQCSGTLTGHHQLSLRHRPKLTPLSVLTTPSKSISVYSTDTWGVEGERQESSRAG